VSEFCVLKRRGCENERFLLLNYFVLFCTPPTEWWLCDLGRPSFGSRRRKCRSRLNIFGGSRPLFDGLCFRGELEAVKVSARKGFKSSLKITFLPGQPVLWIGKRLLAMLWESWQKESSPRLDERRLYLCVSRSCLIAFFAFYFLSRLLPSSWDRSAANDCSGCYLSSKKPPASYPVTVEDLSQQPKVWLVLEKRLSGVARADYFSGPRHPDLHSKKGSDSSVYLGWCLRPFGTSKAFCLMGFEVGLFEFSCSILRHSSSILEVALPLQALGGLNILDDFSLLFASWRVMRPLGFINLAVRARVLLLVWISIL